MVGDEVRLMPAQYVKAYVKHNETDAADAAAICWAVGRPSTADQQAALLLHRGRERLVRQRAALVNALRAHLATNRLDISLQATPAPHTTCLFQRGAIQTRIGLDE
jgi:hypothetical protein